MKYTVSGEVTISTYTVVEADSPKEAKAKAMDRNLIGLCHQCGDYQTAHEEWVTSGELDGEPKITKIEEGEAN